MESDDRIIRLEDEVRELRLRLRFLAGLVPLELLGIVTGVERPLHPLDAEELRHHGDMLPSSIDIELARVWSRSRQKLA